MLNLDRKYFIKNNPYEDSPKSIGYGATIPAPHIHAISLVLDYNYLKELLKEHLKSASKCLDVGFGSGYMTAAMRLMM